MHVIRGTLTAGFGLAIALASGCTADSGQQPTQTSQSLTVAAAPATTQATGIVSWEVYGLPNDVQTIGIGADGAVISAIEIQVIDDQTIAMRTIGDHPEELRFNKTGQVLINTLTSDPRTQRNLQAMSNDMQAVKQQYSFWKCLGSALVAEAACDAAAVELGLNPAADAGCVGALILEANECSE